METNIENLKENISKVAEYTVKKTNEFVTMTKLKIKKADIKSKIINVYQEIGEMVYLNSKEDEDVSDRLNFLISKIDDLRDELNECTKEMDSLKE